MKAKPQLVTKHCSVCSANVLVVEQENAGPYFCQTHMQDLCCMSHVRDLWGRKHHCNTVVPIIKRYESGKYRHYCQSHWKTRTNKCRICNSKATDVGYDGYGYCKHHNVGKKQQLFCAQEALNSLPSDVSDMICSYL